jgi:hypothetical protein
MSEDIWGIRTYCNVKNLGTKFNEIVIPPCCVPSKFYLNNAEIFTIEFEAYYYRSHDYETLVKFIQEKAASLSTYDVMPF